MKRFRHPSGSHGHCAPAIDRHSGRLYSGITGSPKRAIEEFHREMANLAQGDAPLRRPQMALIPRLSTSE